MNPPPDPFNALGRTVYRLHGWRKWLAAAAGYAIRLYYKTLRWQVSPDTLAQLNNSKPPRILLIWHNRSFIISSVFIRFLTPEKITCLISPSRQAAWEVEFFESIGIDVVRGSTTRRSIPALRELIRAVRHSQDIAIGPDGPKGPVYAFQPGAVLLGEKTDAGYLALNVNTTQAIRIRSWDRHLFPLPFAKVELRARWIPHAAVTGSSMKDKAEFLRREFLELVDEPAHLFEHGNS